MDELTETFTNMKVLQLPELARFHNMDKDGSDKKLSCGSGPRKPDGSNRPAVYCFWTVNNTEIKRGTVHNE